MIYWEKISGDYTVSTGTLWTGQKGVFVSRTINPTSLYLEPPGKKVGAMLWVLLDPDVNPNHNLRIYGAPSQSVIKPSAPNYYVSNNELSTAYFMAIDENTWAIFQSGGFFPI